MNANEKPFSIKILDSNFDLVTILNYSDLQWNREYNEAGTFVIDGAKGHIPFNRTTWRYVYTEKRKELGVISQANWRQDATRSTLTLSGYFIESELDKMIVYSLPTHFYNDSGTNYGVSVNKITGTPEWKSQSGTADVVAQAFFEGFKKINYTNYNIGDFDGDTLVTSEFALDITFGTIDHDHGAYHRSIHNRNNERLGYKLYDILKESNASIEIVFDYENKTKTLNIIHGIDRSQTNYQQGYNPVLMTSKNGSIKTASVVVSDTNTRDAVVQVSKDEGQTLVLVNSKSDSIGRFTFSEMKSLQLEYIQEDTQDKATADKQHKLAVMGDASEVLYDKKDRFNIQFDYVNSSYEYMTDFDLGDKISVDIPEIDLSVDVQILSCHEVINNGVWSLNLEVGTPLIRKRGNV